MGLLRLAKLCELTYKINSQIEADAMETEQGEALQVKHIRYYKDENTDAEFVVFVGLHNDNKEFIFKGTDSKKDMLHDLQFFPLTFHNPKKEDEVEFYVHSGFYEQFDSIKEELHKEMIPKGKGPKNLLAGHSLGGALAIIAAIYFHCLDFEFERIATFGAPRVICRNFAKWYEERLRDQTIRVINAFDTIPHLPAKGPVFEYKHVDCHLITIKYGYLVPKSNNIKGFFECFRSIFYRGDMHCIRQYIEDLENFEFLKLI